jgi:outer membrane protein assembly factor BamB
MKSPICLVNRKRTASFRIACRMLAIAPLWLMLAAVNLSAHAQTSDDISNSAAAAPSPADWTQFHRDNMLRWNPYETVLGVGNVGKSQVKWKKLFQNGVLNSSPAVVNAVVYFGAHDQVYALDARTGTELWTYATGGQVNSSPAVANGVVYVGSCLGNIGDMYALNAGSGTLLWIYQTCLCGILACRVEWSGLFR